MRRIAIGLLRQTSAKLAAEAADQLQWHAHD